MTQESGQLSDGEMENIKDFLTIDEAAHLVGLSHWTIRMYLQRRRLAKYRLGSRTVVSRKELLALVHVEKVRPANGQMSSPAGADDAPRPQNSEGTK